jgi:hypothetical protein
MEHEREQLVHGIITSLEENAAARGITLHESFKVELLNYSRHEGVRALSDQQLEVVLVELTGRAIRRTREQRRERALEAPGEDVRAVILELCGTWVHCYAAAEKLLTVRHRRATGERSPAGPKRGAPAK